MKEIRILSILKNERGVTAIIVGVFILFVAIGIAAFAIDFGYRHVAQNELQNAADAGALAGANALFSPGGTEIEIGCNQIAYDTARANLSVNSAVEVKWVPDQNDGSDVERGHWSFSGHGSPGDSDYCPIGFSANDSFDMTDLWGKSAAGLDIDTEYINAVRVTVRREETPTPSFFARIFGHDDFKQRATAVAYIGFAGTFAPGEIDFPMVLCEEEIYPDDPNHSESPVCSSAILYEKTETAMWTNLIQVDLEDEDTENDTCGTNAAQMKDLMGNVLNTGNVYAITTGEDIGVQNGIIDSVLQILIDEWDDTTTELDGTSPDGTRRRVMRATFPVAPCSDNQCVPVTGAVEIDILWIIKKAVTNSEEYGKAPYRYYDADTIDADGKVIEGGLLFENNEPDDELRWKAFQEHFDPDLPTVVDDKLTKTVFFRPTCKPAIPTGGPGGINSGVHADRAVLVR